MLFLPLYFALSGLNTDLGLLNDGRTWAYVVAICAIAFAGKMVGGTLAARASRLVWRESLTIGCLMSCKGLVELIVLVSQAGLPRVLLGRRNCARADDAVSRISDCKPRSSPRPLSQSLWSWLW